MPLAGLFPHDLPACLKRADFSPEYSRPQALRMRDENNPLPADFSVAEYLGGVILAAAIC